MNGGSREIRFISVLWIHLKNNLGLEKKPNAILWRLEDTFHKDLDYFVEFL